MNQKDLILEFMSQGAHDLVYIDALSLESNSHEECLRLLYSDYDLAALLFTVSLGSIVIEVESVWIDPKEDLYIHANCPTFEGDLLFSSLPDSLQYDIALAVREQLRREFNFRKLN